MATLSYRDILQTKTQNTNQHFQNSRFCHRIAELATLLGIRITVGYTLGLVHHYLLLLFVLVALLLRVFVWELL